MPRHFGRKIALVSCLFVVSATAPAARAENNGAGQVPDLKQTLDYGLKARLPSEFAFIQRVVHAVEEKKIPRQSVLSTMSWARNQNGKIPFPYFEFALRKQAKKLRVDL